MVISGLSVDKQDAETRKRFAALLADERVPDDDDTHPKSHADHAFYARLAGLYETFTGKLGGYTQVQHLGVYRGRFVDMVTLVDSVVRVKLGKQPHRNATIGDFVKKMYKAQRDLARSKEVQTD